MAFLAFVFFYGIPLLARLSGFVYDLRESGEPIIGGDTTPPPPPSFETPVSHTNKNNLEISGSSEAGSTITFYFNNKKSEVLVNNEGKFSQTFSLNKGENSLYAYSTDTSGNQSVDSRTYEIFQDSEPPDLELLTPKNGAEFYGTKNRQINIEGTTEPEARVQINERWVIIDSFGKFPFPVSLNEGDNVFKIKASDLAENETLIEIQLKYLP